MKWCKKQKNILSINDFIYPERGTHFAPMIVNLKGIFFAFENFIPIGGF